LALDAVGEKNRSPFEDDEKSRNKHFVSRGATILEKGLEHPA